MTRAAVAIRLSMRDERCRRVLRDTGGADEGCLRGRADRLRPACALRDAGVAGVAGVVAAPDKIEQPAQDRVKTDQRVRRAGAAAADDRRPARGPRAHLRGRGSARPRRAGAALCGDLMHGRQRLSKLLLRDDVIYEDTASMWTARHCAWFTKLDLGGRAQLTLLMNYRHAIDAMVIRRDALQARSPSWSPARCGPNLSRGCAACVGSTRSRRSGCAPRSASSSASTERAG